MATDSAGCGDNAVAAGLSCVRRKLSECSLKRRGGGTEPRLVAVSKTKPVDIILTAYHNGQRHFGENYVQELVEKSNHPLLSELGDIHWHFIGHLQRNKCNNVAAVPHLWGVETVDSVCLATALDTSWGRRGESGRKLKTFIQVNTSGEPSKHGCDRTQSCKLARFITENCKHLELAGLMTIGRKGHDYSTGANPDFEELIETRREVGKLLGVAEDGLELSMGMSADFEHAAMAGSTNVRVGSMIFGKREQEK